MRTNAWQNQRNDNDSNDNLQTREPSNERDGEICLGLIYERNAMQRDRTLKLNAKQQNAKQNEPKQAPSAETMQRTNKNAETTQQQQMQSNATNDSAADERERDNGD